MDNYKERKEVAEWLNGLGYSFDKDVIDIILAWSALKKPETSESNAMLPGVIASNIKDIAKQAYEDIEKGIAWNFIEAKYLIDMKCNKDVEYNNKIIEAINTCFGENEYKLTPFFGLIFDE